MSILTPPLSKRGILKALGQDPSKSDVLTVSTNPDGVVKLAGDGLDWMRVGYDVVIVMPGQSNGDSRGSLVNIEPPHPGAWLYDKQEKVRLLVEPAGKTGDGWINNVPAGLPADATTAAGHSCATTLAKQLLQYGVRPLIVPCAVGSTDLTTHWLPPAVEDDRTTLFGAMTYRAKQAMRPGIPPVFVWIGHEGNASATDWNLATGAAGSAYAVKWAENVRQLRKRFPDCTVLYVQLGAYFTSAAALTRHVVACDQQRRLETGFFDPSFVSGTYVDAKPIAGADIAIVNTDATNSVTINDDGSIRIVSDGVKAAGFYSVQVKKGLTYRLSLNVRAGLTGGIRVSADAQKTAFTTAGAKTLVFVPDADTKLQIYRNSACDVTIDSLVLEEDLYNYAKVNCHMFVAHDIPRNAAPDDVHFSAAGQKALGYRIGKLYAERVLSLAGANGAGPRLVSVTKVSSTVIKVKFNKTIIDSATGYGATLATSLFRVYDAGVEKTLSACARDAGDDTAVQITLSAATTGTVVVTYGDRVPPSGAEQWRPGVVTDADGVPAPAFMQLAV